MKITLTAKQAASFKDMRERANEGCRVCPCCRSGLYIPAAYRTTIGLFHTYRTDLYHCRECGAEWESERYRTK